MFSKVNIHIKWNNHTFCPEHLYVIFTYTTKQVKIKIYFSEAK